MKFYRLILALPILSATLLCAGPLFAQEPDDNERPKPAARAYPVILDSIDQQGQTADQQPNLQADTAPLTGLQTPTIGSQPLLHSYWLPGFQYAGIFQSRDEGGSGAGWTGNHYMVGSLSLLEAWSHAQLALNYSGGGFLSNDKSIGNGNFQQMGLAQNVSLGRIQLQFLDQFSYLPESQFGFGGVTSLAAPGSGGTLAPLPPGLGSNVTPNQSIFSSAGPRYSNTFATQVSYATSERGSITVAGSYGILRFVDAGDFDDDNALGSLGYNYALTSRDSLGVVYRLSTFHFSGNAQAISDQTASIAYSRKITGRLALQLYGGPELTELRVRTNGQSSRLSGSGSASLNYVLQRGGLSVSYSHGTTGGAGILLGSTSDLVNLGGNRQISRRWTALGSFGYAYNRSISTGPSANSQPGFNSWFVTAGLTRLLSPDASFSFGYTARFQTSSTAACPIAACGTSLTQHQVSVGLQWNARPMVIR
jgi:hypothetical protein